MDDNGYLNLIAATIAAGVKHFVLVTSMGTDDILNPLNLFWGVSVPEGCWRGVQGVGVRMLLMGGGGGGDM